MSMVRPTRSAPHRRRAGFTAIEVMFSTTLVALIVGGVTSSFWTIESAFDEQVATAELQLKSRAAMDRLVRVTSGALTTDAAFQQVDATATMKTTTGFDSTHNLTETTKIVSASNVLSFREVSTVVNGAAVYDDLTRYFLVGPGSTTGCDGIVIGRGPNLDSISLFAAGADGVLGTEDDATDVEFDLGVPAVETLLPAEFAPESGSMLEFSVDPASSGRLVTITIRANVQRPDGTFLLTDDLVLEQRVALRW